MSNGVIATIPRMQFSGPLGVPLAGGKLITYLAGSTTPEPTYQDQALTIANPTSITLDATGSCVLWLDPTKSYKFVLKNKLGVTQPGWPVDNISGASNLLSLQPTLSEYVKFTTLAGATGAELVGYHPPGAADPVTLQEALDSLDFIKQKKTYIVVITGQSNAVGANNGGPNPGSSRVKVWDGVTGAWGSSDYSQAPWTRSSPDGNGGNNNIGLAFAHRLVDEEGATVYLIYDAAGGRPIEDWMAAGTASVRYAAIRAKVQAALASPELIAAGKTKIDFLIFAQGEENSLTDTISAYDVKLATLDNQFRAESWMTAMTPMFIMGMSGLHTRYQVWQAQIDYCENGNRNCIYVNSAGLKTGYDVDPTNPANDYTHWLGDSLWEHGYHRVWYAMRERGMSHRQSTPTAFYSRGNGPWRGQTDAISMFDNLIGYSCRTGGIGLTDTFTGDGVKTAFPLTLVGGGISSVTLDGTTTTAYTVAGQVLTFAAAPAIGAAIVVTYSQTINGSAATGSISWGYRCSADGNYTMGGGYLVTIDNLCNYSFGWGREVTFDANGDYSGGFGFQNSVIANYGFVAGRGNTVADAGGAAVGQFSKYTTAQTDPVIWQVGVGATSATRKNGFAVRKSGITEMDSLPVYADNAAAMAGGLLGGQNYRTATGVVMVRY
jgi:hypothetical protein